MGGVETHCENLYPRLAAMGYDITVVRRDSYVKGDTRTVWQGVKLLDVATPRKKAFEAIIHTFRAVWAARRAGADMVHIHAVGPSLAVPFAKLLGLRVVTTNHGPDYERNKWGTLAKKIIKLGESLGARFSDDVIVISDVIRRNLATRYHRTRNVHLIYNGVSDPEICTDDAYFRSLGIAPQRYVLGMCRFVPEKNLHHLIDAFLLSGLATEGYKLVLAGDADFEDDYSRMLKEKARANGVVLTGFVKGRPLHALLSNAACYSLPSSHEGLPIALLEAMSYGLPVVVSDIPANMEVHLPADDYFHVGDIDTLAAKLRAKVAPGPANVDTSIADISVADPVSPAKPTYDLTSYNWDSIARQTATVYGRP
jgi:glycosyltransferase involved in cell wall biosynthesis